MGEHAACPPLEIQGMRLSIANSGQKLLECTRRLAAWWRSSTNAQTTTVLIGAISCNDLHRTPFVSITVASKPTESRREP